jgi:hypothetical protein
MRFCSALVIAISLSVDQAVGLGIAQLSNLDGRWRPEKAAGPDGGGGRH